MSAESDAEFIGRLDARSGEQPPLKVGNATFDYDASVHGWTVKETATHKVSVCILLYHFRVAITRHDQPWGWEHGWCYSDEHDPKGDLTRATLAALVWDPDAEAEPFGWSKRACHCVRTL